MIKGRTENYIIKYIINIIYNIIILLYIAEELRTESICNFYTSIFDKFEGFSQVKVKMKNFSGSGDSGSDQRSNFPVPC